MEGTSQNLLHSECNFLCPHVNAQFRYDSALMSLNPYAAPPRSVRTPALVAQSALGLAAGVYLLGTPFSVWSVFLLSESETVFTGAMISLGVALLVAATFIFGAVAFMVWLFQARTVLDPHDQYLEWKRGWTIGGWFIPIANFFIPLLVVGEISRYAQSRWGRDVPRTAFYVWATSWVLAQLVGNLSNLSSLGDSTMEGPVAVSGGAIVFELVSMVLIVTAGVAGVLMIRQITAALEQPASPWEGQVPVGHPQHLG